jgi:hypothetical protein
MSLTFSLSYMSAKSGPIRSPIPVNPITDSSETDHFFVSKDGSGQILVSAWNVLPNKEGFHAQGAFVHEKS